MWNISTSLCSHTKWTTPATSLLTRVAMSTSSSSPIFFYSNVNIDRSDSTNLLSWIVADVGRSFSRWLVVHYAIEWQRIVFVSALQRQHRCRWKMKEWKKKDVWFCCMAESSFFCRVLYQQNWQVQSASETIRRRRRKRRRKKKQPPPSSPPCVDGDVLVLTP